MIAYLRGRIILRKDNWIILENQGLGYKVFVPGYISTDNPSELYISHQVREDSQTLYGFLSLAECSLFELLLTVSGVGPKSALGIMGIGSVDRIQNAILAGDPALFETVSGIGKKAAAKIIVELKNKLGGVGGSYLPEVDTGTGDLIQALESLGYRRSEILPIVSEIAQNGQSMQDQLRLALKKLSTK